jgi:hypothetical protein
LWPGEVAAAVAILEAYRPKATNAEVLDSFVAYLQAREAWIANDRQRRIGQQ